MKFLQGLRVSFPRIVVGVCLVGSSAGALDVTGNGISDLYEKAGNGGKLPVPAITALGDEDGDGVSNLLESIGGSDLRDGASFFRAFVSIQDDALVITWSPLLLEKQYTVFSSPDLSDGSWTEIARFIADGSQTGHSVPLAEVSGGFFRVSATDVASTANPGYTRHELWTLGLDPDVAHAELPPAGGGGAIVDPNSDNSGPTDAFDASPGDAAIDWPRASEGLRYMWIPVEGNTGGFKAVDMSERGHVLFTRIDPPDLPSDYDTKPVGKVWDPSKAVAGRVSEVFFRPQGLVLRMWSRDAGSGGVAALPVPWPMVNDDFNNHSISVAVHSIGADGSVMGNVGYGYSLDEGAHPEHPEIHRTPEGGEYVFVWRGDGYTSCRLLGEDRGFLRADEEEVVWTANHAAGFISRVENGRVAVEALAFDQNRNGMGTPTTLDLRSWKMEGGGVAGDFTVSMAFPNRGYSPSLGGYPHAWLTGMPRAVVPYISGPDLRYRAGGVDVENGYYFDGISELPAGGWGLGDSLGSFRIRKGGSFVDATSANGVVRFDKQGLGIGDGQGIRQIWRNAEWVSFAEMTGLPDGTFNGMKPRKLTPGGLVWVSNDQGTANGILVPVTLKDNKFATGLDDQSLLADATDPGYQKKHWIMAPCGGAEYNNDVRFVSPSDLPLALSVGSGNATVSPSSFTGFAGTEPVVNWKGNGAASNDITASFGLGEAGAQDPAIGVKAMKKRTVRVKVFPVRHKESLRPVPVPPEGELRQKLKEIFGYQLNAWPEIEIAPQTVYDYAGASTTGYEDGYKLDANTPKEHDMILASQYQSPNHDIIVFLIDNVGYWGEGKPINGYAYPPPRVGAVPATANHCIINVGDGRVDSIRSDIEIIRTVGHEMGHLMIGAGHPDENIAGGKGPAPLEGTDRTKRLMCGGGNEHFFKNPGSISGAILLVKKEWDEAERWLVKFPDERYRRENALGGGSPIGNY